MKPLSKLSTGEYAYIVDLRDSTLTAELLEMGCYPGDLIRIEDNQDHTNFLIFRCRKQYFHLFKDRAKSIITNVVSFDFCLN